MPDTHAVIDPPIVAPVAAAAVQMADPLIALGAECRRLEAVLAKCDQPAPIEDRLTARLIEIEDAIEASVPTSPTGAAVLVRRLKDRRAFEWDEYDDRIVENLIAGLSCMKGTALPRQITPCSAVGKRTRTPKS